MNIGHMLQTNYYHLQKVTQLNAFTVFATIMMVSMLLAQFVACVYKRRVYSTWRTKVQTKKKNIVCTNHIICKLCTLYNEAVKNQSEKKINKKNHKCIYEHLIIQILYMGKKFFS